MARKPAKLPYDVVQVDWIDSSCAQGWRSHTQLFLCGCTQVVTVGFRLEDEDGSVRICDGIADTGEYSNVWYIPRFAVKKVTTLAKRGGEER